MICLDVGMSNHGVIYVIEHLEPRLSPWCLLEYKHISKVVGKSKVWFTNVKKPSKALKDLGRVFSKPSHLFPLPNPCVLDPLAKKTLSSNELNRISHLIFGGILGDHPPKERTREIFPDQYVLRRNLGSKQMSTDTAVLVAKAIVGGGRLSKISFKDVIEIPLNKGESVLLPYRYLVRNRNPVIAPGLIHYLKRKRSI